MIDVHDKGLLFFGREKDIVKALFPAVVSFVFLQGFFPFRPADPLHQFGQIGEMIIEALPADSAVGADIRNRHFGDGLGLEDFLQGGGKCFFG